MILSRVRRYIRNWITQDFIEDVFNSAVDIEIESTTAFGPNDNSFPTWCTLVSLQDVKIRKPGLSFRFPFYIGYKRYSEFSTEKPFLVRTYMTSIVISVDRKYGRMLFKDQNQNMCYIENVSIPNFIRPGNVLAGGEVLGIAEQARIRVTYFDTAEQTILPITDCLLDR